VNGSGLVEANAVLPLLLLSESPAIATALAERRLGPLEPLTPKARERMRETALAYVRSRGNAAEMARSMHVHPQTARYRLARLRELLGDDLDDPSARLELELALLGSGGTG
jgi:DNA-binding PucR family transcriptional regulator